MAIAASLKSKLRAKFVVLDGPDGSGKTTQQKMLADRLQAHDIDLLAVRDPGSTPVGEAIRKIILSGDYGRLSPRCELLLFMAARAQMIAEKILPAIKSGKLVLADRFISASCAYQGASGLDLGSIVQLGKFAVGTTWPDLTIILDVPIDVGMERIRRNGGSTLDAMESRPAEFHGQVRRNFLSLKQLYPGSVEVIDATGPVDDVHQRVMEILERVDF